MRFMQRRALTGLAVAAALMPATLWAQDAKNQGYLVDAITGNIVTSATSGLCVRTSDWTPARAVAQCDPDLVKKAAPPPAPAAKPEAKPEAKPAAAPAPAAAPRLMPTLSPSARTAALSAVHVSRTRSKSACISSMVSK